MVTPISLKISRTVSSEVLFQLLSGITNISWHSCLKYCSFAEHFLSRIQFFFNKLLIRLVVTKSWDSIFVNLSLKAVSSVFIFDNRQHNYYKIYFDIRVSNLGNSSLVNFLSILSHITIAHVKLHFKIISPYN